MKAKQKDKMPTKCFALHYKSLPFSAFVAGVGNEKAMKIRHADLYRKFFWL